jgi:hypothetical protein
VPALVALGRVTDDVFFSSDGQDTAVRHNCASALRSLTCKAEIRTLLIEAGAISVILDDAQVTVTLKWLCVCADVYDGYCTNCSVDSLNCTLYAMYNPTVPADFCYVSVCVSQPSPLHSYCSDAIIANTLTAMHMLLYLCSYTTVIHY